jgi:DNA invertase Pin-like site-specific DNA recombinase
MRNFFGYVRVSTQQQDYETQKQAILKFMNYKFPDNSITFFEEKISGRKKNRPVLMELQNQLKEGDTLIIYDLTRLGRSVTELFRIVDDLHEKKATLLIISSGLDTSTHIGNLLFQVSAIISEFEVTLLRERTTIALEAKRQQGIKLGRPRKSTKVLEKAYRLYKQKIEEKDTTTSVRDICQDLHISKSSFYRYLNTKETIDLPVIKETDQEIN